MPVFRDPVVGEPVATSVAPTVRAPAIHGSPAAGTPPTFAPVVQLVPVLPNPVVGASTASSEADRSYLPGLYPNVGEELSVEPLGAQPAVSARQEPLSGMSRVALSISCSVGFPGLVAYCLPKPTTSTSHERELFLGE